MLFLALAATACGRLGFSDGADAGPGAGDGALDAAPACATSRWETVRTVDELKLGGTVWSHAWGHGGKQVVFEYHGVGGGDLFLATFDDATGRFGEPRRLTELSTGRTEASPTLSEDGLELFYTSTDAQDRNHIMRATRASPTATFGTAVRFADNAYGPDLGRGDLDLVYNDSNGMVIRSRAAAGSASFAAPIPIDSVNKGGWPSLSRDGLELYFEYDTNRPIHIARRPDRDSPFSTPQPLTDLENGADPDISSDGQWLLYVTFEPENLPKLAKRVCLDSN